MFGAGVGLVGCGGDLSDIDRRVDRVLADRSALIGGDAAAPRRAWQSPDLPRHRDLADKAPPTSNPRASELRFTAASEKRDFAKRLDKLQQQTAGAEDASVLRFDLPGAWRQTQTTARDYLSAEEDYILAGIRLLIERHRWSPRLFATTAASAGANYNNGNRTSSAVNVVNTLGVRKELPFGGDVAATWVWDASEDLRSAATGRYRQSSRLVLDGNIPLLRGFGLVAEEGRIQAERGLIYAARDFESFRRQFLVDIARDYFALLQQQDGLASTERQVENLRNIRDRQQALYDAGRVAKFDVNLSNNDVLSAEAGLANTRESLLLALDAFRVRLGLPEGTRIRIEPSEFAVPEPDVSLEAAVSLALDFRLDLQNQRDRLDDTKRGVLIAQNQLLPDLNLSGGVTLPTKAGEREGGSVYELDDIQYSAGLTLNWPIDKENERLGLRQSIIGLHQSQRSFDQFRDNLIIEVRARVREIERARFNLKLAEDRVEINLRRKEEQDIKSDEVEAQALVDTANAIRDAERARDQAKADLRNSVLEYLLRTGTMRVRRDGTFEPLPGMENAPTADLPPDAPTRLPPIEETP